jgi:sialidase-1
MQSTIPFAPGHTAADYHEPHAVETADGRIVVVIRNHGTPFQGETLQTGSADGGRTWAVPHSIGVWGTPAHLLRLRDGRLLLTHGYRRPSFGNHARGSADGGGTWSEPLTLSADGLGADLGYPSSVELDDGTILTIWYEVMQGNPRAVLRQARWVIRDR